MLSCLQGAIILGNHGGRMALSDLHVCKPWACTIVRDVRSASTSARLKCSPCRTENWSRSLVPRHPDSLFCRKSVLFQGKEARGTQGGRNDPSTVLLAQFFQDIATAAQLINEEFNEGATKEFVATCIPGITNSVLAFKYVFHGLCGTPLEALLLPSENTFPSNT